MSTFDPDSLERRLAELEEELNAPGLLGRPEPRGEGLGRARARLAAARGLPARCCATTTTRASSRRSTAARWTTRSPTSLEPLRRELERLQEAALFDGEYDAGDAVVTLQSGTGGTDAQDWAEMMLRMYERWAANRGFEVELLEASPGEEAGLKSATFTVGGENAYGILKAERGKHRLVRLSPFDQAHRRHTAFATVIVAPLLPDDADVEIDDDDLKIDTYRAQGAGGQHVNKTDSAVRITHLPTGIVVQCQNERSQSANKQTAMRVLKARLVERAEEEREAVMAKERGGSADTGFGGESDPLLRPPPVPTRERLAHRLRDGKRPGRPRRRARSVHPRVPARPGRRKDRLEGEATLARHLRTGAPR